jgi:hypothetical protein
LRKWYWEGWTDSYFVWLCCGEPPREQVLGSQEAKGGHIRLSRVSSARGTLLSSHGHDEAILRRQSWRAAQARSLCYFVLMTSGSVSDTLLSTADRPRHNIQDRARSVGQYPMLYFQRPTGPGMIHKTEREVSVCIR